MDLHFFSTETLATHTTHEDYCIFCSKRHTTWSIDAFQLYTQASAPGFTSFIRHTFGGGGEVHLIMQKNTVGLTAK